MISNIVIDAPAKINLFLGVSTKRDSRGYHLVDSIMAAVDLADVIEIIPADEFNITCIPQVDFPAKSNTVWTAVKAMEKAFNKKADFQVVIHKNIPFKAGLGGASADAAAIILATAKLWGVEAQAEKLQEIAASIGADTPFFLYGKPMHLTGAGDIPYEEFGDLEACHICLIRPYGDGITAQRAYKEFDAHPEASYDIKPMVEALRKSDISLVAKVVSNDLDPVAQRIMPNLSEVLAWMKTEPGVMSSMVTGSGSCMYAICDSRNSAEALSRKAQDKGLWSWSGLLRNCGPQFLDQP